MLNKELLIELLIMLTIAGLSYKSGYLKGWHMQAEETEKVIQEYKNLKNEYSEYVANCEANHYILYRR